MPQWIPTADWDGRDVFIIGGGPSLKNFDWSLLHPELTIGCNSAFTLGEQVCKICLFEDLTWFETYKEELVRFKGSVFSSCPHLHNGPHSKVSWVWVVDRRASGLHSTALGWNGNAGSCAINLALILGAKRVYLLGFDMKRVGSCSNWHDRILRPSATTPEVYQRFVRSFKAVVRDWHIKYADREIWNLTVESGLGPQMFPWLDPNVFWEERVNQRSSLSKDTPACLIGSRSIE